MKGNNKIEKPGLRNIKTVVAILFCIVVCNLFGRNPLVSAMAALFTVENNMDQTLHTGMTRLFATIFGGVIGTIFMCIIYAMEGEFATTIMVPLGIFIIIYVCSKVMGRAGGFVSIACMTFLSINFEANENGNIDLMYAVATTCDTLIGVMFGMLVNVFPLKKKRRMVNVSPSQGKKRIGR